jgi:3-oxoadipate enol-lactonase
MPVVQIDGRSVEFVRSGSGTPVVLSSPTWWPLDAWNVSGIPQLRAAHEVVAFNHRGIGESTSAGAPYTVLSMADDLVAVADALELEPFHLVGYAIGAAVALAAAVRHRKRIRSLTLAAPSGGLPATAPSPLEPVRREVAELGFEGHVRSHPVATAHPAFEREQPLRAAQLSDALWLHQGSFENFLEHAQARRGYNAVELATGLDVPALIVVGADDEAARGMSSPVESARAVAAALPDSRTIVLERVGHMPFWESPAVWAAVLAFLREVEG